MYVEKKDESLAPLGESRVSLKPSSAPLVESPDTLRQPRTDIRKSSAHTGESHVPLKAHPRPPAAPSGPRALSRESSAPTEKPSAPLGAPSTPPRELRGSPKQPPAPTGKSPAQLAPPEKPPAPPEKPEKPTTSAETLQYRTVEECE